MSDRVLIFGNGWLGNRLAKRLGGTIDETDITDRWSTVEVLEEERPTVVINAAGKTGRPNVDSCEDEPALTLAVNVGGPIILAQECIARKIFMVHLGSGCIYTGAGPGMIADGGGYREDDSPTFAGSLYSRSKATAEQALRNLRVLQVRLRMPFDGTPHPRNLITKITKYEKVISVLNSLTCVDDFLEATAQLIATREVGVWNIVNPGPLTHPEILDLYREIVDPDFRYEVMPLEELSQKVKTGRSNCVLSVHKLENSAGIKLRTAKEALRYALLEYKTKMRETQ